MLVHQATKTEFMDDVESDAIAQRITLAFERLVHRANPRELGAWQNSMQYMYKVLNTSEIPGACGVAIEFRVPYTSSRIDFLLTGRESSGRDAAVIIELKQWSEVEAIRAKDGVVRAFVAGTHREVSHPSYQAWSYARMIEDYNESVREARIQLQPCAYLHNYEVADGYDPLLDPVYRPYLDKAPPFCKGDILKLRNFICRHIRHGDDGKVLFHIESGRLRPSKSLQDALTSMLAGNEEFLMIDDQKVVFEAAVHLARESRRSGKKQVLIVRGGPGTGKSVIAVNLLVRLTAEEMVCQYVSKNSAPRNVYSKKLLQGDRSRAYINSLFQGPGKFHEHTGAPLDAVIVDEAHRLNEKSGLFGNLGENQIKEIIAASRFAVFFIDEAQRVTIKDIGSVDDIRSFAKRAGAGVSEAELSSQFRCNGSDGYLEWLDAALGIRPPKEAGLAFDYDFRVFDDPNELFRAIAEKNGTTNRSRLVAGYCWQWPEASKGDPRSHDIVLPEWGFSKSWNLNATGTWAIDEGSLDHVGCVHTAQGLEFDYVGVIVGDDLRFEQGRVVTDHTKRAKSDASLKGIKSLEKKDPERAGRLADELIRNTYRVLMTRGLKGCYVFCTDPALAEHLKEQRRRAQMVDEAQGDLPAPVRQEREPEGRSELLPFRILSPDETRPYENCVPLYELKAAAGLFSEEQQVGEAEVVPPEDVRWAELPDAFRPRRDLFVAQVIGESMNRRIPNGSWCLFRLASGGTREGKVVLVQHRDIWDAETGGHFTVKVYHSEKVAQEDGWRHQRILLTPDTTAPGYEPIALGPEAEGALTVIGELVAVLG